MGRAWSPRTGLVAQPRGRLGARVSVGTEMSLRVSQSPPLCPARNVAAGGVGGQGGRRPCVTAPSGSAGVQLAEAGAGSGRLLGGSGSCSARVSSCSSGALAFPRAHTSRRRQLQVRKKTKNKTRWGRGRAPGSGTGATVQLDSPGTVSPAPAAAFSLDGSSALTRPSPPLSSLLEASLRACLQTEEILDFIPEEGLSPTPKQAQISD